MGSKPAELLKFRQAQLHRQIRDALNLLQGPLHQNPSQRGYHLNTKVNQKTVTKYVRQELVPRVRAMTANHLKIRKLLQRLSDRARTCARSKPFRNMCRKTLSWSRARWLSEPKICTSFILFLN
ncbi:MAG: hypothetical protein WCO56_26685 [Verrucomicrobiota bacterium]